MEEKSSVLTSVLILGLCVFVGVGLYFLFNNFNVKSGNKEEVLETLDIESDIVQELDDYLMYPDLIDKEFLLTIDESTLSNNTIVKYAINHLKEEVTNGLSQCEAKTYNEEELRSIIKKVFGTEKSNMDFNELENGQVEYKYDAENKVLEVIPKLCGEGVYIDTIELLQKAEKDDNHIYIYNELKYKAAADEEYKIYSEKYTYKLEDDNYYFVKLELTEN